MASIVGPCGGIKLSNKFTVDENGIIDVKQEPQTIPNHNDLKGREVAEAHPISAINGLSQVIDTLNDTKKTIYVDTESANIVQNGSSLYPYVDLRTAQSSVSPTRQTMVVKAGSDIVEAYSTGTNLLQLLGAESDFEGALTIQKAGFQYLIKNHKGNLTIENNCSVVVMGNLEGDIVSTAQNCTITILGELKGNVTCGVAKSMLLRAGIFDSVTYQISDENALKDGSIVGNQTYGLVAKR